MKKRISAIITALVLMLCMLVGCAEDGVNGINGKDGTNGADGKNGTVWYQGTDTPTAELGVEGDFYFKTDEKTVWTRTEQGWQVISNLAAESKESGPSWYSGEGKPDNGKGVDGDLYLNTESREIYIKEAGEWLLYGNFATDTIKQDWDEDGVLKILCIGNSFSDDSMEYVYQIASDLGVESIKLGNLFIGGCSLETHLNNAKNDSAAYTYRTNTSGSWSNSYNYKISTAVASENWDFISFQQVSGYSGVSESYSDLLSLINIVEPMCPDAKLVWHMTWAYQEGSSHGDFSKYDKEQLTMYNAIISAVQENVLDNGKISIVIPAGTSIQNVRTSFVGDSVTRDTYHLNNYGRYIGGITFVKALLGEDVDLNSLDYAPEEVTAAQLQVAVECVSNAVDAPFEITESVFDTEPQISVEGLSELDYAVTKCAYYNSDASRQLSTTASNSPQFFATEIFTKETLPVGSVIEIAEGWQYRPECWIGNTNGGSRPNNVSTYRIEITEGWWGDYTARAFNISKIGNPSLSSYSEDDIKEIFKIYSA